MTWSSSLTGSGDVGSGLGSLATLYPGSQVKQNDENRSSRFAATAFEEFASR